MSDDQFDRVPPQDIDAEMSVLGSMMLTTEAANVVSEMLRGQDFYQPSHETIFDTIVELNGRAEPADAITVAGELKRAGVLSKVGGAAYLHTLIAAGVRVAELDDARSRGDEAAHDGALAHDARVVGGVRGGGHGGDEAVQVGGAAHLR